MRTSSRATTSRQQPAGADDSMPPLAMSPAAPKDSHNDPSWLRVGLTLTVALPAGIALGWGAFQLWPGATVRPFSTSTTIAATDAPSGTLSLRETDGLTVDGPEPDGPTADGPGDESSAATTDAPGGTGASAATDAPPSSPVAEQEDWIPETLSTQRTRLFARMRRGLRLDEAQMAAVEAIFAASPVLGQGNPEITQHPMARSTCRERRAAAGVVDVDEPRCGGPHRVPVFNPEAGQAARDARVCVDQFEFPGLPCEYPVVHVRAREAALLCKAVGKRLCDAHEWEGACAGALRPVEKEYTWGRPRPEAKHQHNVTRTRVWSYGPEKDHPRCATGSVRTPGCPGGGYDKCGSNTYPAGAFPACGSPFGAFDLHGNVAEHMSFPLRPEELGAAGGDGMTEMKGSWFVFATVNAHEDDCRWRAPDWHGTRVMSETSHLNYHLGFRCCADVADAALAAP
ncbi:SUMF1/EgtB/PvdO family nonheme iron enzyme [Chondromyces crocatus]|uniref:Sulfatase-modifying factor enzyme-like domain-containing protein n=1 Tax=Chondromyces crocatus TaxID=52 RepID=A0A0K1EC77_CHOCO|nr:SUMF1/EgtB/PvdO family nonheme iron enzyme [Chondromyces crocatus]AKT38475.1 uncharacterized protein CMC5_026220 [Chondromyces crocatus]